jgi:uncharacterized membrane protein YozB (DUF420 family)
MSDQNLNVQRNPAYGKQTSSLAVVSLVLGIASYFVIPVIGAIGAIITGNMARKEIRQNQGALTGEGMARWGTILGWIHIGLSVIGMCLALILVVLAILTAFGVMTIPFLILPFGNGGGF